MLKVLRQRKTSTASDDSQPFLPKTNNPIPKTTKDNLIKRLRRSHCFYLVLLILVVVSWKTVFFPHNNFIAFGFVDISPLRIMYGPLFNELGLCSNTSFYWNNVALQPKSHLYDCTFDLCEPWSHGGESWIYQGICRSITSNYNQTMTPAPLPVILKSMKSRWGSTLKQEIQASRIVSHSSELQLYKHGWNFILVTNLQYYNRLTLYRKPKLLLQALEEYWNQLKHLHLHGILHLDIWQPNLLFHRDNLKDQYNFQLIDFSSARYTSERNLLQENIFSKAWHLPKFPLLVCQLPSHRKDAYCINQDVGNLCLGFLDAYPLAVRILHNLVGGGSTMPYKSSLPTLDELVDRHDKVLGRFRHASNEFRNDPIIPWIASFIDPLQLNITRVCGGGNHLPKPNISILATPT